MFAYRQKIPRMILGDWPDESYSTVTDFARFRG
jgi:hypothetical protein